SWAIARPRSTRCARRARWADDVSARFGRFPRADTKPWCDPSRGFPQFPQAFCQSPTARRGGPIPATENTCVPLEGPENGFPPVSAGFRRCATSSAGPVFPEDSRFPPFAPFPPLILRLRTSRRQSGRVVALAAADRRAPAEGSMLMNIMPILCRRSAGISHNIAQERQASLSTFLRKSVIHPASRAAGLGLLRVLLEVHFSLDSG